MGPNMCRYEKTVPEGMLFVRIVCIFELMVRIPLLIIGVILVAIISSAPSFGSPRVLDLIVYPDGSTHISAEIGIDSLAVNYELELFGDNIDNFVAVGENGFLLAGNITGDSALVETFGSSVITVEYDTHDLVSKQGRVWTFSLDAPADFTLLLPENSAIVGMTNLPINMEVLDDQTLLTLSSGSNEIDYLFSATAPTPIPGNPEPQQDYLPYVIIGAISAAAIILLVRIRQKPAKSAQVQKSQMDPEAIFKIKPDIRDDDKEIVKFISDNGGEVLESELRKKFLQPRTTMWRAVKRLERNSIIKIEKKDMQNLVKLRNIEEEEQ